MRKQIIPLLLVLSVSLVISPAQAKQETITYEQLLSITGPQTVHVLAKTDEPNNIIGSNLTTKTTWDLLIKNDQGDYVKTDLKTNMAQYDKMSLSERAHVLQHGEIILTVTIDESGQWTAQYGTQSGSGNRDYYIFIVILVLCFFSIFLPVRVKTAHGYETKPSKSFAALAFLTAFLPDKNCHRKNR